MTASLPLSLLTEISPASPLTTPPPPRHHGTILTPSRHLMSSRCHPDVIPMSLDGSGNIITISSSGARSLTIHLDTGLFITEQGRGEIIIYRLQSNNPSMKILSSHNNLYHISLPLSLSLHIYMDIIFNTNILTES